VARFGGWIGGFIKPTFHQTPREDSSVPPILVTCLNTHKPTTLTQNHRNTIYQYQYQYQCKCTRIQYQKNNVNSVNQCPFYQIFFLILLVSFLDCSLSLSKNSLC